MATRFESFTRNTGFQWKSTEVVYLGEVFGAVFLFAMSYLTVGDVTLAWLSVDDDVVWYMTFDGWMGSGYCS